MPSPSPNEDSPEWNEGDAQILTHVYIGLVAGHKSTCVLQCSLLYDYNEEHPHASKPLCGGGCLVQRSFVIILAIFMDDSALVDDFTRHALRIIRRLCSNKAKRSHHHVDFSQSDDRCRLTLNL